MKRNPDTLALAMDYAQAMESCAAYCAVTQPAIRTPEDAARLLRPVMDAATSGNSQETFFILLLTVKNRPAAAPVECMRGLLDTCPVHPREVFREAVRNGQTASVILAHNHPLCGSQHKGCSAEIIIMRRCQSVAGTTPTACNTWTAGCHAIAQHNFVEFPFYNLT